jgi:beta-glucanase (GH16 family)
MKRYLFFILFFTAILHTFSQSIFDNFESPTSSLNWVGDNCGVNVNFTNPFQSGINTSSKVLRYSDSGGAYANIRFDQSQNFSLYYNPIFTLKIYIPSTGITGNQPNQISLKLQNGTLNEPWTTQSEIIKAVTLNQWQTISFNFATDTFVNFNGNSVNPIYRQDFNRVLLQINGENNTDFVTAYIDDFFYNYANTAVEPVFDNLVWSDEFDGTGAINAQKWHHQTQLPNGGSWFNGEIQHYTNRIQNSNVSNGSLKIVAIREQFNDQGQTKPFTAARLNSKFAFRYGRIEVRAKLPTGIGTWPAIWTLGKNITETGGYWASNFGTTGWPACGEIDIMEHWGNNQNFVQSALHTPSSFGNTVNKGGRVIPTVSSQFHIYSVDWSAEKMVFKIDNVTHYIYNPAVKNPSTYPFTDEQYILLNFAIQNTIGGSFNQGVFEVDYVRVYQETPLTVVDFADKNKIVLYPNPTKTTVTIQTEQVIKEKTIYDLQGKLIKTISNNTKEINVDDLQAGIYLLKIEDENGLMITKKLLKN